MVESNLINYDKENNNFHYITSNNIKTINLNNDDIQKVKVNWLK